MVKSLRQFVPMFANSAAFRGILTLLERTGAEKANLLRVLTYHRVDDPDARPWLNRDLISATPTDFEAQMKYLSSNYHLISVFDVLDAIEKREAKTLPRRAVLVTFDDAYADFEEHAWPVLKHYQVPVTLFVPTAFPDRPERLFWWDRLFHAVHNTRARDVQTPLGTLPTSTAAERAQTFSRLKNYIKSLPNDQALALVAELGVQLSVKTHDNCVLSWDALRKLARDGVTLAAHTQTHPIMNHISPAAMEREALGSLSDLQREIGPTPPVFAYPSGFHNQEVVDALKRTGFKLAFTTERGINDLNHADPLRLQRINVGARTTIPILQAQLLALSASLYPIGRKFLAN